jgi:16S rRNA (cytidine1402-2'-O)-methyltransferase
MKDANASTFASFRKCIQQGKSIGIISEAGCPGVADPGQQFVNIAQQLNVTVKPLVGPSSILLALMASGMNGQQFQFFGYLPIDSTLKIQAIKGLETESKNNNCTQIFIETPYRNNQMAEVLVRTCKPTTLLCIAAELTSPQEFVKTKTIADWKNSLPDLHKRTAIFLMLAQ